MVYKLSEQDTLCTFKMDNNEKIIGKLHNVIVYGYEKAARDVKDVSLQQMFRLYS
jgi:hypothetical protein